MLQNPSPSRLAGEVGRRLECKPRAAHPTTCGTPALTLPWTRLDGHGMAEAAHGGLSSRTAAELLRQALPPSRELHRTDAASRRRQAGFTGPVGRMLSGGGGVGPRRRMQPRPSCSVQPAFRQLRRRHRLLHDSSGHRSLGSDGRRASQPQVGWASVLQCRSMWPAGSAEHVLAGRAGHCNAAFCPSMPASTATRPLQQ